MALYWVFNDIPETMEDAIILLQENGVDVSDCVTDKPITEKYVVGSFLDKLRKLYKVPATIDDNWSPDYPPEEAEYHDTMAFKPLSNEEVKQYKECIALLKPIKMKGSGDFMDKLNKRIANECKASLYQRFIAWCKKWTDEEVSYLLFWVITIYLMIGIIQYEPKMLEIFLWPFM